LQKQDALAQSVSLHHLPQMLSYLEVIISSLDSTSRKTFQTLHLMGTYRNRIQADIHGILSKVAHLRIDQHPHRPVEEHRHPHRLQEEWVVHLLRRLQ